jgi:cadmium resistance protein CadD (predicted permease)
MPGVADSPIGTAASAALLFAGTDVDDLIVLTLLFLAARAGGRPRPWQIVVGQYAGIATLVAVSALAALGLTLVPDRWVGLAGLLPLGIGVWGLIQAVRARGEDEQPLPTVPTGVLPIAALTIANGADNIAVYTPVFRTLGTADTLLMIAIFALLLGAWCGLARWLGSHRRVTAVVDRYGHWLVPVVFIAIGAVILSAVVRG